MTRTLALTAAIVAAATLGGAAFAQATTGSTDHAHHIEGHLSFSRTHHGHHGHHGGGHHGGGHHGGGHHGGGHHGGGHHGGGHGGGGGGHHHHHHHDLPTGQRMH